MTMEQKIAILVAGLKVIDQGPDAIEAAVEAAYKKVMKTEVGSTDEKEET